MSPSNKKYAFSGKVALVTGSSSGIGAAIAIQFAQYGAQVTITGRDAANLDKVAQKIQQVSGGVAPLQIVGDLTDDTFPAKLINETVAKFNRIDFLVNNAGAATPKGSLASPNLLEEFDFVIKLNVRSIVELTQRALPYLEKTKGNIVNISSIAGLRPNILNYSVSKAALDMVTKTSALELGPKGIRVNSVNPGPVETAFPRGLGFNQDKTSKFWSVLADQSPIGRIGQPEDIANLVSFLASDDARNITGSIYVSDSGWYNAGTKPDFGKILQD